MNPAGIHSTPRPWPHFRGVQILLITYMVSTFISYFYGDVKGLCVWTYLYRFGNGIEPMFEAENLRAQVKTRTLHNSKSAALVNLFIPWLDLRGV
jgi:hypothetical protein